MAYLTLYSSTPARHRRTLRAIATEAHEQRRGVWAVDESANFELVDHDSLGPPDGAVILPKLFRRCTDYLKAREAGFPGLLPEWLVAASASGRRPENDLLLIGGSTEVSFSSVVQHLNDRIRLTVDLLDVVFVEEVGTGLAAARAIRGLRTDQERSSESGMCRANCLAAATFLRS